MDFSSVDSTVGSTVGSTVVKYMLFDSYLYHPITIAPLVRGHNNLPAKIDYYFCYLSGLHTNKITRPAHFRLLSNWHKVSCKYCHRYAFYGLAKILTFEFYVCLKGLRIVRSLPLWFPA